MIINVLHARVANLHANVTYVRAMRHPSLSHAECDYYFTILESAMAFLENADASCLNINADKFAECGAVSSAQHHALRQRTCSHALKHQLASLGRSCGAEPVCGVVRRELSRRRRSSAAPSC